ncbi:hypothetical protein N5079_12665 [Planotetraspora sp. A-T 1434]|nr:hypothetical protein [Planotetraspora sp. A-T 1434]MCT9931068.1 hypothetical protein [Planotetraspora sp. A-T 1434]
MCPANRGSVAVAVPAAARICAVRLPPSSLVTRATSGMTTPTHRAGTIRGATTVSPKTAVDTRAIIGVSGGVSK